MEVVIGLSWKRDVSELKYVLVGVPVPLNLGGLVTLLLDTDDTVDADDEVVVRFAGIVATD